jgi:hypothetical protein
MAVVMIVLAGCTTTNDYAVIASREQVDGVSTCYRQCQQVRGSGTNALLGCLKTCPDVYIYNDHDCSEAKYDSTNYWCTTEHNKSFTVLPILLVVLVVVLLGAIGAAAGSSKN